MGKFGDGNLVHSGGVEGVRSAFKNMHWYTCRWVTRWVVTHLVCRRTD